MRHKHTTHADQTPGFYKNGRACEGEAEGVAAVGWVQGHAPESYQRVGPDGGKARGQGTRKIAYLLRYVDAESNMTLSIPAAAVLFLALGLLKQGYW